MSHKRAKRERKTGQNYSSLAEHKQSGSILTPPWMTYSNMTPSSWVDERLPEMAWAALLVTQMGRHLALEIFREIADYIRRLEAKTQRVSITHSGLAKIAPDLTNQIVEIITKTPESRKSLKPLVAFPNLPAHATWIRYLGEPNEEIDWTPLADAIGRTLNHQSQEATDCRWMKVLTRIASGQMRMATSDHVREIVEYPNFGDQRKV